MTTAAELPHTTPSSEVPRKRRGPSLSVQVFIGMGLGIVAGATRGVRRRTHSAKMYRASVARPPSCVGLQTVQGRIRGTTACGGSV